MGGTDENKQRTASGAWGARKASEISGKQESDYFSVEPNDNEQATSNPFYAPMQNRTGSIESNDGYEGFRTS